jgi:hypothetical protein
MQTSRRCLPVGYDMRLHEQVVLLKSDICHMVSGGSAPGRAKHKGYVSHRASAPRPLNPNLRSPSSELIPLWWSNHNRTQSYAPHL